MINAFTKELFKGNPAMIVLVDEELSEEVMHRYAKEFNQPITTFVRVGEEVVHLRWFTPTQEIDLCGHGTLAAAHVLWSEGHIPSGQSITFSTKGGKLRAEQVKNKILLGFNQIRAEMVNITKELREVVNVDVKAAAWAKDRYILEFEQEEDVIQAIPDLSKMDHLPGAGVVITSKGTTSDIVSRYFAPKIGVKEDSVTGSAHCALASYWNQLTGDTKWSAYQASERGGFIEMELDGADVTLGGECIVLMKGHLQ
ncbi:PhzF family phenazine biosynthesis protein [Bacillus sp. NTK071]|uniref:PhzF family phenazine biosynthesis protein n=1 Tax=Bacillus sp. NTK071 TaxID=2802175 RepID=UPI001A90CBC5|nr:PhzF family phenazine biosynthesis protein [Bacillus sp. NTK071]MBN8210591.1 PhzF family phenazine biosynthesis protein [Bacillus sp. NTK071]